MVGLTAIPDPYRSRTPMVLDRHPVQWSGGTVLVLPPLKWTRGIGNWVGVSIRPTIDHASRPIPQGRTGRGEMVATPLTYTPSGTSEIESTTRVAAFWAAPPLTALSSPRARS